MTNIKILVLEDDLDYATALARQLTLMYKDFSVTVISNHEAMNTDSKKYDLLLAGDRAEETGKLLVEEFLKRGCCIRLISRPAAKPQSGFGSRQGAAEPELSFWRRGRVSELAALIFAVHASVSGRERASLDLSGITKLTGFLSGTGGMERTSATLAFCRMLSREKQRRTLYLSFEELDSIEFYFQASKGGKQLGEYLYYLFSREESAAATYLDAFLFQDRYGVYSFHPSPGRNELPFLSEQELIHFFSVLLRFGEFHHIVLDLPVSFRPEMLFLMRSCGNLIFLTDEMPYTLHQSRHLRKILAQEYLGVEEEQLPLVYVNGIDNRSAAFWQEEQDSYQKLGREMETLAEQLYG